MKKPGALSTLGDSVHTAGLTVVRCRTQPHLADYSGIFLVSTRAASAGSLFP
ncbi:hypothetical protein SAMN05443245_4690 [Paraburkholderia fungorum]|uniref:Uncharacterized protein n=1 Tax=Paraburkholderia fungorum TaxID=134537 RepID=A0A1H1I5S1_9BURK|nr:hypothetical protein SAMN05443245_4690 [Paraburkholderia fungorum]